MKPIELLRLWGFGLEGLGKIGMGLQNTVRKRTSGGWRRTRVNNTMWTPHKGLALARAQKKMSQIVNNHSLCKKRGTSYKESYARSCTSRDR